jgi:hypothetical protein
MSVGGLMLANHCAFAVGGRKKLPSQNTQTDRPPPMTLTSGLNKSRLRDSGIVSWVLCHAQHVPIGLR